MKKYIINLLYLLYLIKYSLCDDNSSETDCDSLNCGDCCIAKGGKHYCG